MTVSMEVFKTWLNEQDALAQWERNTRSRFKQKTEVSSGAVSHSMTWIDTPESEEFWLDLHYAWERRFNELTLNQ